MKKMDNWAPNSDASIALLTLGWMTFAHDKGWSLI